MRGGGDVSPGAVVRAQPLRLSLGGSHAPLWWGVAMLVVIEVVGYATLFTAYLYLRFHTPEWPPAGVPRPSVALGGVGAVMLLASAGAVRWGMLGLLREHTAQLRLGFAAATALALGFMVVHAIERANAGFRWDEHAYGSVIWTISAVHMLHVLALAVMGGVVWVLAGRGYFSRERRLGAEGVALFWYCVALIWLPVFAVVYLVAW